MDKKITINDFLEKEFKTAKRSVITGITSVNDLKEMEENGVKLNRKHSEAVENYDRYRLYMLKTAVDDEEFRSRYEVLQVMANLRSFEEFLDPKYSAGS